MIFLQRIRNNTISRHDYLLSRQNQPERFWTEQIVCRSRYMIRIFPVTKHLLDNNCQDGIGFFFAFCVLFLFNVPIFSFKRKSIDGNGCFSQNNVFFVLEVFRFYSACVCVFDLNKIQRTRSTRRKIFR